MSASFSLTCAYRYGPSLTWRRNFSLVDWASRPENKQAWQTLMNTSQGQLTSSPFDDPEANFAFGDAAFRRISSLSMNKARLFGWTGFADTTEVLFEMYSEMGELGVLPRLKVDRPRPLI